MAGVSKGSLEFFVVWIESDMYPLVGLSVLIDCEGVCVVVCILPLFVVPCL